MVSDRNLGGITGGSNPYGTSAFNQFASRLTNKTNKSRTPISPIVKAPKTTTEPVIPNYLGDFSFSSPSKPAQPSPTTGGYSGGGVSSTYTGTVAQPMKPPSFEDWKPDDETYQDTIAAGRRSLNDLLANLEAQKSNYQTDISTMLRNLGFRGATVGDTITGGQWDDSDRLGAFGQAFQNMMNDYASRGMLRSSLFADAENDLRRGFDNQREDIATALTQFLSGLARDRTSAEQQFAELQAQAAREAAARYAATFGVDVPRTSS